MTREQWLKYHSTYERKAFTIVNKTLQQAMTINWDNITEFNYKYAIPLNINIEALKNGYYELYYNIGLLHAKRTGKEINELIKDDIETKAFTIGTFTEIFKRSVTNFIAEIAASRIRSVSQTLAEFLVKEMNLRLNEGKTIREVAKEMQEKVNKRNFYRWQALRIARTETTAAANFGALESILNSGVEMEKEWISERDSRTRRKPEDKFDHYVMDGVRVGPYQEFNVQGDFIMYPGDPNSNPSNSINCRCTIGGRPKRNTEGKLIYK